MTDNLKPAQTYHAWAQANAFLEGKASPQDKNKLYPPLPSTSPWHGDVVPIEPPLGDGE